MKKILLIFLFVVVVLTGCSNLFANSDYNNEQKISSEYNTWSLDKVDQSIQSNQFECQAIINGMCVIWSYDAEEAEDIDINYLINATKGKAKIVFIKPDGTIETIVEQTNESKAEDYTSDILHVEKGENRIKLVASKGTEVEFDITISEGNFQKLGL